MTAKLWIPGQVDVLPHRCLACGAKGFKSKRAYIDHTVSCAERNGEKYRRHAAARDDNYITGVADKERYEFERQTMAGVRSRKKYVTVPKGIPNDKGKNDA